MQEFNKKVFILTIVVLVFCVCLARFPSDDGLRHVGLAFSDSRSWGDVYPFSQFEAFKDYDPWFGYDLVLKTIASGLKCFPFPILLDQFVLTNVLSLFFSLVFFYLALQRSGILDDIKDRDSFTLALLILLALLLLPFLRVMIIRPFAFGTFFLLYAIGGKGFIRGALSCAALTFVYPYLAWFYTIPAGLAHLLKGDRRFAIGAISLTVLFLCFQPHTFWGFQAALFGSGLTRDAMNFQIGELCPSYYGLSFYVCLALFFILYPLFPEKTKKLNVANILIIIYLLPAVKYVRYFTDLTLPLLFVAFGRGALAVLLEPYRRLVSYWGNVLMSAFKRMKLPKFKTAGSINLKPYLAVGYIIVFAVFLYQNCDRLQSLKKFQADISPIPAGALVLTDFNLQYKILYVRPDLRIIPSCEIGFPRANIRNEYIDFHKEGKIADLAGKTGAEFFVEYRHMYIDPRDGSALKLIKKGSDVNLWRIEVNSCGSP